nr:hypothetical protein [Tanacetum cinerariifolium]
MDTIIPLGQKNNLAEYMILSGADNRPPMLDKNLYDSWKSKIELYMQNREHERMILESVENGPLIWPTVEENGVTRIKKYDELSVAEKIQTDCDMKATNIIFQVQQIQGRQGQSYFGTGYKSNATCSRGNNTEDLNTYDSDRDDISNAKAVLVDNISNYGFDVILEIPHSETYLNDTKNQSVHAM